MKPVQSSVKRRSIFVNRFIFKRVKNELGQRNKKINHFITGIVFTHFLFGALVRYLLILFSNFGEYFLNFATNIFPSRWISDAAQVDFIPANYHEDQFWPQMTWHCHCWNCENCENFENCCKNNKKGGNHKTAKSSFGSRTNNLTKL